MDWDRSRRFDDHRGGESYRPGSSRGFSRRSRSPPRMRSPSTRLVADTWAPSTDRSYNRPRSRSPPFRRRSRSPQSFSRPSGIGSYPRAYPSRRFSHRRDVRPRSPPSTSRRPRSPPLREGRARDIGWSQTPPQRQPRDSSSGREYGYYQKERRIPSAGQGLRSRSPSRHGTSFAEDHRSMPAPRTRSPLYGPHRVRDTAQDRFPGQRRRSRSPSSKRPSAPGSKSNSRRSSPLDDRNKTPSRVNQSRSPQAIHGPDRRGSKDWANPSGQKDRNNLPRNKLESPEAKLSSPAAERAYETPLSSHVDVESSRQSHIQDRANNNQTSYPSNAPSQPKAFSANRNHKSPPPGPTHGPKNLPSHPRASNMSLLSAPTRPRGNFSFKDNGWGSTPMRRGPPSTASHGMPVAPRSSQLSAAGTETYRPGPCHNTSVQGNSSPHTPRHFRYLVGLNTILPGGRLAPLEFDTVTEKRLSQLDSDRDRIFEQITENQKLKRAGLRDWDRLDRESSVCALRSELAEGHLQCITDTEGSLGRILF